jgi:hypothetical protein
MIYALAADAPHPRFPWRVRAVPGGGAQVIPICGSIVAWH